MGKRKKGDKIDGWINLDKPMGMTSTQAVAKVRWLFNAQKAGHAGTLDPLATGILPIALGEATKTIPYCQDASKTYEFTITWGENRDTLDAEGTVTATSDKRPTQNEIQTALAQFIGDIQQIPPKYSAIKIDGARAYDLAREGLNFEIQSREVFVHSLSVSPEISAGAEMTSFVMTCGKGTYVRSIARDLADALGTCGYVSFLRRTAVGAFTLNNAFLLDNEDDVRNSAGLKDALLPLETALDDIPALSINTAEVTDLRHGRVLNFVSRPNFERVAEFKKGQEIITLHNGSPVAMCEFQSPTLKPIRVFNLNT